MGERYELFVAVLELVRVEALLPYFRGQVGRPEEDRAALARAFIAKAVFDSLPTTRALIERLEVDGRLSAAVRLERCRPASERGDVFAGLFRVCREPSCRRRLHETLIARTMDGHLVEHISRDATAIVLRGRSRRRSRRQRSRSGASGGGHARERRGRRSRAGWNGN